VGKGEPDSLGRHRTGHGHHARGHGCLLVALRAGSVVDGAAGTLGLDGASSVPPVAGLGVACARMAANQDNVWESARRDLDVAAERLKLDEGMHRVLRVPKRELEVNFPVTMDDGSVQVFTGYRVHHNLNRGPATGGVRYTSDLTLDLVRANAMLSTWKSALLEVPWGGA